MQHLQALLRLSGCCLPVPKALLKFQHPHVHMDVEEKDRVQRGYGLGLLTHLSSAGIAECLTGMAYVAVGGAEPGALCMHMRQVLYQLLL